MVRRQAGSDFGSEAASANNIEVMGVDVPESLTPGRPIPITVVLKNNAEIVTPLDPDYCISGIKAGQTVQVVASVAGGETQRASTCIPAFGGERSIPLQLQGPDSPSSVTIEILVRGENSGREVVSRTATVAVGDADAVPPGDSNGSDNNDDSGDDADTAGSLTEWWRGLTGQEKAMIALGASGAVFAVSRR